MDVMSVDSLNERVAEEIRVMLARRNISAAELARRTGITQRSMSRRITGEKAIDLLDLEKIARALEVEVTTLLPAADLNHRSGHMPESMSPRANTHPAGSAVRTTPASTTRTTRRPTATTATGRTRRPAWQHG
jgi:DNA-binding Xre family transcriptional regulator